LYNLPEDLPDVEVAEVAFQKRRAVAGNGFLPPHLQRVVVISCVLRHDDEVWLFSIGEPEAAEPVALQRFFDGINKYAPQLVSWNGRNFDLPVLVARGLIHGVAAACFWDTGQDNKDAKWANYINRFHDRHLDLMDVLSIYGGRGAARKPDGKVVFVEGALPGERAAVQIMTGGKRFDLGRANRLLAESPSRRVPRCPHFGVCGGCATQHADLATQMAAKQDGLE